MAPQNFNRSTLTPIDNLPISIDGNMLDQNTLTSISIKGNGASGAGVLKLEITVSDLNQLESIKNYLANTYGV